MNKLLLFLCAALLISCSSDDDSPDNNDNDPAAMAYVTGKMNNDPFDYTFRNNANDTYLYNPNTGYSGDGTDRWYYYGGSLTTFNPPTYAPVFYIGWNNMYFGQGGDVEGQSAAFYNTVSNLPSNYLTEAQNDANNPGLEISFESQNGVFYSSTVGIQNGSTLSIDGSTEGVSNGMKTKTVWGTFSCKMYNYDDPTDVIEVTAGKFKIILTEFQ